MNNNSRGKLVTACSCMKWSTGLLNEAISHATLWFCFLFNHIIFIGRTGGRDTLIKIVVCFGPCQVSGTALVLDEIINHVQSLQRQVEVILDIPV